MIAYTQMNERDYIESGWCPQFSAKQAIFDDLRELFARSLGQSWPTMASLNTLIPAAAKTTSGQKISFVAQAGKMTALEYEQQIWRSGGIPTRAGEWHDLFNALMWCLFPRSKACLNALHISSTDGNPGTQRSRLRDALTLIDECGIVIPSCYSGPRDANIKHDWRQLFVTTRDHWRLDRRAMIIGHGLYQQCLRPYLGLTAKALYVKVEPEFFDCALSDQYRQVDDLLQAELQRRGPALRSGDLLAFPLLGVPGWHPENHDPQFYERQDYFRPPKR